jgi:hypothetical protein
MYAESKVAILQFPSFGGVPNGRGGPQNENEIENEYVHDIRHCQNRALKI